MLQTKNIDIEHLKELVYRKLSDRGIVFNEDILNSSYVNKSENLASRIFNVSSTDEYVGEIKKDYPQLNSELNIVALYLNKTDETQDKSSIVKYTEKFIEVVNKSNIPETSKTELNSCTSVYANSLSLW